MRDYPDRIMLFAAGFGTRMGALTKAFPKPLIKVAGLSLIDHALAIATEANIDKIVVNTHYKSELLKAHLKDKNVLFSDEAELLETGGGLRNALPLLGSDPVFTLNSDAIWTGSNPLRQLLDAWRPDQMDALLLMVDHNHARGHTRDGDFLIGNDGRLTRGPGSIYPGAQIIRTELLHEIPQDAFSLNLLWDMLEKRQRLFGVTHDGHWCDVGSPTGIQEAETMLRDHDV